MDKSVIRIGVGRRWTTSFLVMILALANGFVAGTAEADSDENGAATSAFDSKFLLALGGFFPRISGTFSLSPSGGGSGTLTFPLPHLGGSISYKISPRWTAQASVVGFALELNEYSGSLLQVDAGASYQLSKNFGIGTGLKYFNLNLQTKDTGGAAEFDYQFFGPAVFGYATF